MESDRIADVGNQIADDAHVERINNPASRCRGGQGNAAAIHADGAANGKGGAAGGVGKGARDDVVLEGRHQPVEAQPLEEGVGRAKEEARRSGIFCVVADPLDVANPCGP